MKKEYEVINNGRRDQEVPAAINFYIILSTGRFLVAFYELSLLCFDYCSIIFNLMYHHCLSDLVGLYIPQTIRPIPTIGRNLIMGTRTPSPT